MHASNDAGARLHHVGLVRPADLAAPLARVHERGQADARERARAAGGAVAHQVAQHAQRQVPRLQLPGARERHKLGAQAGPAAPAGFPGASVHLAR